jgi:hypothetical protein
MVHQLLYQDTVIVTKADKKGPLSFSRLIDDLDEIPDFSLVLKNSLEFQTFSRPGGSPVGTHAGLHVT